MPIIGNTVGTPQNPADWNVSDPLNVSNIAGKPTITQGEKKIDFQAQRASNLLDPTEPQDAVTLAYLNSHEHPVGSIYPTFEKEDLPAAKFGGTWSLIEQGLVLLSAGQDYAAGQKYGSAEHSHTGSGYAKVALRGQQLNYKQINVPKWGANYGNDFVKTSPFPSGSGLDIAAEVKTETDQKSNLQPSIAIFIWRRTA